MRTHDPSAALHLKCTVGSTAGSSPILGGAVAAVAAVVAVMAVVVLGGMNADTPTKPLPLLL